MCLFLSIDCKFDYSSSDNLVFSFFREIKFFVDVYNWRGVSILF